MTLGETSGDYRGGPIGSVHFFFAMNSDFTKVLARIQELAAPYVESLGLSLWGIEFTGGTGRPTLRVFIDGDDGVDVEDCARVSRQLGTALDVEDLLHGAYQLEVSSPGLERRFFEFSQLAPYVGRELDVTTSLPMDGRKRFKGALVSIEGQALILECEGVRFEIPWSEVSRARLVHTFETPEESKARARGRGKAAGNSKADKDAGPGEA